MPRLPTLVFFPLATTFFSSSSFRTDVRKWHANFIFPLKPQPNGRLSNKMFKQYEAKNKKKKDSDKKCKYSEYKTT